MEHTILRPDTVTLAEYSKELCSEWDKEKNGDLTPEMVSSHSSRKVWWRCKEGHSWESTVANRVYGSKCPFCTGKKVISGKNDLASLYPEIAKEWHPTLNGDVKPSDVMPKSTKAYWWQCAKGHVWQARVASRTHGTGCPFCAGSKPLVGENDLATLYPDLVALWHPDLNGTLKPEDVTPGSGRKVWWFENGKTFETYVWCMVKKHNTSKQTS